MVTVLFWGYNFVSVKLVYQQVTPAALALVRYLAMWALLHLVCAVLKRPVKVDPSDRAKVWAAGLVSMGVYMIFFLEGMRRTTAPEGAILLSTTPLLTYIFSLIAKIEEPKPLAMAGTVVAFGGVTAVILGGVKATGNGSLLGNALVFTGAVVWALSTMQMRPLLAKYEALPLFTASMPGALLVLLPFGLQDSMAVAWSSLTPQTWINLVQITVGSGTIAFVCFYLGVKQVGPAMATRYQFFVPIFAAFVAWLVLGQTLNVVQWIGIAVVISGVFLTSYARFAGSKPKAAA